MGRGVFALLGFASLVLCGFFMEGGATEVLLHPLPVIVCMVVLPVVLALIILYTQAQVWHAFHPEHSLESQKMALAFWSMAERLSLLAAVMGTVVGLIISFQYLGCPIESFGRKIAASVLPLLAGLFQAVFCRIQRGRVEAMAFHLEGLIEGKPSVEVQRSEL